MADPGASYDGASEFAATCLWNLEKGCLAKVLVPAEARAGENDKIITVRSTCANPSRSVPRAGFCQLILGILVDFLLDVLFRATRNTDE